MLVSGHFPRLIVSRLSPCAEQLGKGVSEHDLFFAFSHKFCFAFGHLLLHQGKIPAAGVVFGLACLRLWTRLAAVLGERSGQSDLTGIHTWRQSGHQAASFPHSFWGINCIAGESHSFVEVISTSPVYHLAQERDEQWSKSSFSNTK